MLKDLKDPNQPNKVDRLTFCLFLSVVFWLAFNIATYHYSNGIVMALAQMSVFLTWGLLITWAIRALLRWQRKSN